MPVSIPIRRADGDHRRQRLEVGDRHAADLGRPVGRVRRDEVAQPGDAVGVGAGVEERLVGATVEHVADEERQQRRVGARRGGEVEVGVVRRLGAPGIDHDELPAARLQVAEVAERVRHHQPVAVGDHGVDADGQQQVGRRQVRA